MVTDYSGELGGIKPGPTKLEGARDVASKWEEAVARRKKSEAGTQEELARMIDHAKNEGELQRIADCNAHFRQVLRSAPP